MKEDNNHQTMKTTIGGNSSSHQQGEEHDHLKLFVVDTWNDEIFMVELPLFIPKAAPRLERKLNWMLRHAASLCLTLPHTLQEHPHTLIGDATLLHLFYSTHLWVSSITAPPRYAHHLIAHKTHTCAHADILYAFESWRSHIHTLLDGANEAHTRAHTHTLEISPLSPVLFFPVLLWGVWHRALTVYWLSRRELCGYTRTYRWLHAV